MKPGDGIQRALDRAARRLVAEALDPDVPRARSWRDEHADEFGPDTRHPNGKDTPRR